LVKKNIFQKFQKPVTHLASVGCKANLFLTYPQLISVNSEVVTPLSVPTMEDGGPELDKIKDKLLGQLDSYIRSKKIVCFDRGVVAREKHADGGWHLHVYLHAVLADGVTKCRIKHSDLDLYQHHGNYQQCRSDEAVMKYCAKEGDFVWWGVDPRLRSKARGNKQNLVLAKVISQSITVEQAVTESPGLFTKYVQLKKSLDLWRAEANRRPVGTSPRFIYLMGPSGVGKTTIARGLFTEEETFLPVLPTRPGDPWWFDGYAGQKCLVFDNVSTDTMPPYDLICQMVDTSSSMVPVKGAVLRCSPHVVVITTTLHPKDLWPSQWDIQMRRRITDFWIASSVTMDDPENANALNDRIVMWTPVPMSRWKVLTLPPQTTRLMKTLKRSLESGVPPDILDPEWPDQPTDPVSSDPARGSGDELMHAEIQIVPAMRMTPIQNGVRLSTDGLLTQRQTITASAASGGAALTTAQLHSNLLGVSRSNAPAVHFMDYATPYPLHEGGCGCPSCFPQ